MRQMVGILVGLLAIGFCEAVANDFYTGVLTETLPDVLSKNVLADFVNATGIAVGRVIDGCVGEYYNQVFHDVPLIKRDLKSATDRILNGPPQEAEAQLRKINTLTQHIVDSLPGNIELKPPNLPDLPLSTDVFGSEATHEDLLKIFTELPDLLDQDVSMIRNLLDNIFLAGWQQVRTTYVTLQENIRTEFLNGDLLPAFAKELAKIDVNSDRIKGKVSFVTRKSFARLSETIKIAYDSLNLGNNNYRRKHLFRKKRISIMSVF